MVIFQNHKGPISNKYFGNTVVDVYGLIENIKYRRIRKYEAVYMH